MLGFLWQIWYNAREVIVQVRAYLENQLPKLRHWQKIKK